jgi:hypothetical protein
MHIRDQYADSTWTEYVGQGVTNFAAIADALRSVNFRDSAGIELAFPNNYVPRTRSSRTGSAALILSALRSAAKAPQQQLDNTNKRPRGVSARVVSCEAWPEDWPEMLRR